VNAGHCGGEHERALHVSIMVWGGGLEKLLSLSKVKIRCQHYMTGKQRVLYFMHKIYSCVTDTNAAQVQQHTLGFCYWFCFWVLAFCLSLVPRPFPSPVFDRLQYANTEGEGLGDLVMCGYVR